jgi:hypothetical protein
MDNYEFILKLIKDGVLQQGKYPWHKHFYVLNTGLSIIDRTKNEDGSEWEIFTKRYTIYVSKISGNLSEQWDKIDWEHLTKEQKRVDEDFSRTPDF